ncbi:uncharacterized protein KIAA1671 homolog [Chanos chanos]|uniref:Uncharacterized protein KIAA1671 homolog n=1 Tax=Chanos chanos TaxID=29144 RepID=A0A6J2VHE1_CHACN|nr:uncharacterized protein KIAA1671 homolog [Chanos chanos]
MIQAMEREKERKRQAEMEKQKEENWLKGSDRLTEEVPTSPNISNQTSASPARPTKPEVLYDDFSVKGSRWGSGKQTSAGSSISTEPESDPLESRTDTTGPQEHPGEEKSPKPRPELLPVQLSGTKQAEEMPSTPDECCVDQEDAGEGRDTEALLGKDEDEKHYGTWNEEDSASPSGQSPLTPESHDLLSDSQDKDLQVHPEPLSPTQTEGGGLRVTDVLQRFTSRHKPLESDSSQSASENPSVESDSTEKAEPLSFPEFTAPSLDFSAQRNRVVLNRKGGAKRALPTRPKRQSAAMPTVTEVDGQDWRFCDSTVSKEPLVESDSEDERPKDKERRLAPSQPQRVALFPGMDTSALMVKLRKRGGNEEPETAEGGGRGDTDGDQADAPAPSSSLLSRSPRSSAVPGGTRVLPPIGAQDSGGTSPPSWFKQLKSKKQKNPQDS